MLGEARSKFASIAGPGSSIQMNGGDLKSSAKEDFERLDKEIDTYVAGGTGYYFITG
jgi:hypothetical protein